MEGLTQTEGALGEGGGGGAVGDMISNSPKTREGHVMKALNGTSDGAYACMLHPEGRGQHLVYTWGSGGVCCTARGGEGGTTG